MPLSRAFVERAEGRMAHLFEPAVFQQQLHIAVYGGLIERFHRHPPGFQYFLNAERAIQLAKNLFDRRPL